MNREEKYTIVVMGQAFELTRSQIEFDSPNYFTMCFLGDFSESKSRLLQLSRDPDLFRIIVNHLSGYSVLPLSEKYFPNYMASATMLMNLRVDALFYQLEDLVQKCDELLAGQQRGTLPSYVAVGGLVRAEGGVSEASDLRCMSREFIVFVTSDDLSKDPFLKLTRLNAPGGPSGFSGLQFMGAVGDILANKLGNQYHKEWRLLGWSNEPCPNDETCNQLGTLASGMSTVVEAR